MSDSSIINLRLFRLLWIFKVYIALFNFQSTPRFINGWQFHNISPIFVFASSSLKIFQTFFELAFSIVLYQPVLSLAIKTRNRNIIYNRFLFLQALVWIFFKLFSDSQFSICFISALLLLAFKARNRNIIYHRFLFLQAQVWNFFKLFFQNLQFRSVLYQPCRLRLLPRRATET